ncbi:MAG: hypothetical protein RLZZ127_1643, partial [Planctomycetota bacterium]
MSTEFPPVPLPELDPDPAAAWRHSEALILDIEAQIGARLTIHDRSGIFSAGPGGGLLCRERTWHRHPACDNHHLGRAAQPCLDHCQDAVNARAALAPGAFRHHCWRALEEVVVPVWRNGAHLATCFAGPFRHPRSRSLDPDPSKALERQRLRVLTDDEARRIARLVLHGADALLANLERLQGLHRPPSRAETIRRFIHYHAHRDIGLDDLAAHLGLSPGRASRAVSRDLGRPFGELLQEERL